MNEMINKEILYKSYILDRLSTTQIARLFGEKQQKIYSLLKKYDIEIRGCKDAAKIRKKKGFKSEFLNNREWLIQKYETEKMTTYEIAKIISSNQRSVLSALKAYKISTRNISESKKIQYEKNKPNFYFLELNDKDWLSEKYIDEKMSCRSIGELIGCNEGTVRRALDRNDIKARNNSESHSLIKIDSKYSLLNNESWLREKYIDEKMGTLEIAKLVGAKTSNSVTQALRKFGLPVRTIGEGLTINREDDGFIFNQNALEVLDGSLLGDASLRVWKKRNINANAFIIKTNKFYDHVLYFSKQIYSTEENAKKYIREKKVTLTYKGIKKTFTYFNISTYSHYELTSIYNKWYPESNNFKKVVPKDIIITPTVLLHWFMDDGCSSLRKRDYKENPKKKWLSRRRKENQVLITFCSESFSKEDQEMLVTQMNKKFNLCAKVIACGFGTGYRVKIPQSKAQYFFKLIGPCPVPSFAYKWKIIS